MAKSPAAILYDADGNPMAVVNGDVIPLGTKGLLFAGRGTGGWSPDPAAFPAGPDLAATGFPQIDGVGNLAVRGQLLTDEKSFRDDFPGTSLDTNLTGTYDFTNGDTAVTGVGTLFTEELTSADYIKITSHGVAVWASVDSVESDTELTLAEPYAGATASAAAHKTHFPTVSAVGVTVASSKVTVASGITASDHRGVWRLVDYCPILVSGFVSVDARRANQVGTFGFVDDVDPAVLIKQARILFDGTVNTVVKFQTSGDGTLETTIVTLPNGYTTATDLEYQIAVLSDECVLAIEGVVAARHTKHIPGPYDTFVVHACWLNSNPGPVGSSVMSLDNVYVSNHNRVQIAQSFAGDTIPVQIREDTHSITAVRTTTATTEVEVIAYTVPTGKTFWLLGYMVSSGTSTVRANPCKIGRGTVPIAEPTNPGVVDNSLYRSFLIEQKSNVSEQFSSPRYLAAAGETVRVTVTPDGTTSTTWRAQLDFVLR